MSFSISNTNICNTKVIKTSTLTGAGGINSNIYLSNGVAYTNTNINSVPSLSCIINSTKEKIINEPYNPVYNYPANK